MSEEDYKDIGAIKNKWIETKDNYLDMALNIIDKLKQENTQLKSVLKEIREKLKEHNYTLNYEPWNFYEIQGNILFDLVEIIDKGIGEDK